MTKDDCFQLGHITKTHGLNGEVVFFLDVDDPSEYEDLDSVLIEVRGELTPYFIESSSINRDRAIVALEDVDTLEEAKKLINCPIWLPLDNLEQITDPDRFYYHEIIGYRIVDKEEGPLGTVSSVMAMPTQDLIAMDYRGQEMLIPINSAIVKTIDRAAKTLNVELPEGLLEVYLTDAGLPDDAVDGDADYDDDKA
ncbi:ribosome maturation factor RimM [Fibrivirga algicola]|uniref:Ribosome maturation factor RimM n=1 Tax=Fibrivirga algicola TaxID=2950420 RepID=A0ABX0QKK8_9BACT|nr:ribosome maturation factor RimM [Fibrivirga algicola]ARK12001.1 16S rRNA processing protein RimM [Fibrella sp. ES10-3-2-2]NID11178.1 16S rRNA processing protein RimM [Fibrivirga algicola]